MLLLAKLLTTLLPMAWKFAGSFGSILSSGSAVVIAAITAIPGILSAIGSFLDAVGKSPLLAFLLGSFMVGSAGFFYGLSYDAPIRAKIQQRAIDAANTKADIAISRVRAEYQRKLDEAMARLAKYETKSAKRSAPR